MIKLSKICKSFDERTVLSNLSLEISENEFVCITGESGAGKTTLLNIIGLLDRPDSGELSINGKIRFANKDILKLRREFFGYIFQDYLLMKDKTVEENLDISKKLVKYKNKKMERKDTEQVMEISGLDLSYLNKKICQLSGGEQQRVAIARMMLKPYELVLADEPTGNLDFRNKNKVIEILKEIKKCGKTIICVTHDKEVADSADRVINLRRL